jgi:hypothetical protein
MPWLFWFFQGFKGLFALLSWWRERERIVLGSVLLWGMGVGICGPVAGVGVWSFVRVVSERRRKREGRIRLVEE